MKQYLKHSILPDQIFEWDTDTKTGRWCFPDGQPIPMGESGFTIKGLFDQGGWEETPDPFIAPELLVDEGL